MDTEEGPASLWDAVRAAGRPELAKRKETATLSQNLFRLGSELTHSLEAECSSVSSGQSQVRALRAWGPASRLGACQRPALEGFSYTRPHTESCRTRRLPRCWGA